MPYCSRPGMCKSKTKVSFGGPLSSEDQSETSQKEGGNDQIQRSIYKDTPSKAHFSPQDILLIQIVQYVHPYIKKKIWETSKRPNTPKHPDSVRGGIVIFAQIKVSIKEKMAKTHLQSTPNLVKIWPKRPKPKPFPHPQDHFGTCRGGAP